MFLILNLREKEKHKLIAVRERNAMKVCFFGNLFPPYINIPYYKYNGNADLSVICP